MSTVVHENIWPDLCNPKEVVDGLRWIASQRVDQSKESIHDVAADLIEDYRAIIDTLQRSKK